MDTRRVGRPPELDDPTRLRQRYRTAGDITIAAELGVGRTAVRKARRRFGIASRAPGRRSTQPFAVARATGSAAASEIASRILNESMPGGPPGTFDLIAARVRSVHQARSARDQLALEDALVGLGAAAGLVLDNLGRLANNAPQR